MSEYIQSQTDEEIVTMLQQYMEEYRNRVAVVVEDGMDIDSLLDFEGAYQQLTAMSIHCMTMYMSLRLLEDSLPVRGKDEEQ